MAAEISKTDPKPNEFARALARHPLIYEAHPPLLRTLPAKAAAMTEDLIRRLGEIKVLDGVNVPELTEEYHGGLMEYKTTDPREFASTVAARIGKEAIVCRVVAQEKSPETYRDWLESARAKGIRNIIPVGGNSRHIVYPGPKVEVATYVAKEVLEPDGGVVGNISIPHRRGEANSLFWKTKMGASFFTTQVLFSSDNVAQLIEDYYRLCAEFNQKPATILLSFATVIDQADLEKLQKLGAQVPEDVKRHIVEAGDISDMWKRCIDNALRVYTEVVSAVESRGTLINLGVNVEQITQRDLIPSIELLKIFGGIIDLPSSQLREKISGIQI